MQPTRYRDIAIRIVVSPQLYGTLQEWALVHYAKSNGHVSAFQRCLGMPITPPEGRLLSGDRASVKLCAGECLKIAAVRSLTSVSLLPPNGQRPPPCHTCRRLTWRCGDEQGCRCGQCSRSLPVAKKKARPPWSCRMHCASMITWQVLYELVQICKAATLDYRNRLEKYKVKAPSLGVKASVPG